MVWCSYCGKDQIAEHNDGFICCTGCGRVLDDNVFSSEPTFAKSASGQSQFVGNIVKQSQYGTYARIVDDGTGTVSGYQSNSHQRTLDKGRQEIRNIASSLSVGGGDDIVGSAHRIYVLAVEKNFTKGRRTSQVAAACLYIVCRQGNKPYLLIDFSDCLQTSVYLLGAVFLQLCTLLRLDQHPMVQKPVDPSLFIHRFTDRLLHRIAPGTSSKNQFAIANTALRIVASMKQDWIQTGRRPSGICGAALLLSTRIHGLECSTADVESVVYVCKATITKRLVEFSNTEAGSLTPEEFEAKAKQREKEMLSVSQTDIVNNGVIKEILCEHKDSGAQHYAHGLCKNCYDDFVKISGGLQGGSAPPAFQRAQKERERLLKNKKRKLTAEAISDEDEDLTCTNSSPVAEKAIKKKLEQEEHSYFDADDVTESCVTHETKAEKRYEDSVDDEPESLSDIDDVELTTYLNTEDEIRLKTIVWTEMNKEYIQEQEAKEAALKAQAESMAAVSTSGTAAEIAAATVVMSRKARKHKHGDTANCKPAESAAEATRQMLEKKRLSSKLNYSVLEKMFNGKEDSPSKWVEEPPGKTEPADTKVPPEEEHDQEGNENENEHENENEAELENDIPSYSYIYEQAVEEDYEEY
ncbi:transcription factor IIIB 60 kDa subunit isoform X1 [Selaginella moellendorffii]|uniref:transcription factor IIIB 60 kDa subunit isoform X1 n=1 Tax=Selaginella moellendorffii TaxID=88036 RepID=UPI000D1C6152|nr:transcription factor IIIB 60 kDa subunit isoform X1 [Selaginella moellendorffii]|eukprot:XP_024543263.1 transcription factor IIIB 60 kDa subunit isoform X1 [Selaginella moellendorffii]